MCGIVIASAHMNKPEKPDVFQTFSRDQGILQMGEIQLRQEN